jgi:hypothetical protein
VNEGTASFDDPLADDLDDEEQFLAAYEEADRHAARVLRQALGGTEVTSPSAAEIAIAAERLRRGIGSGGYPFDWIRRAAGLSGPGTLPHDDAELLLQCAEGTISPRNETGLAPEDEALVASLEHADWLGAVLTLARAGPGASTEPRALVAGIRSCPEVETEGEFALDEESHLETAFELVSLPWELMGLIDQDRLLTSLGAWALPRALARAWGSDLDAPEDG